MRAEAIAKALGGAAGWRAARLTRTVNPSLSIHDADGGKVLVRCHAGCDQARVKLEAARSAAT